MRKIGKIFRFLLPVIALAALVVFMTGAGRREKAKLEKNKALVTRYEKEFWIKRNMKVADEIVASDHVRHLFSGQEDVRGREALKRYAQDCYTAWPDFNFTTEFMIAEGDKVASFCTLTGTHTGTAWGIPPSGNKINFIGVYIQRIADGKIVETWAVGDMLTAMSQMGFKLVPAEEKGKK